MTDSANGKYRPVPGKIPGTVVNLGGVDYTLAPLNLIQVEALDDSIRKLGSSQDMKENFEIALPLVHASMTRNYPDVTLEDVRLLLDMGNFMAATQAVVRISGYTPSASGEAVPASQ